MRTTTRRAMAAATLVPLLTGLAACSSGDKDKDAAGGNPGQQACGPLPTANPSAALPTGFPAGDEEFLYEPSTQGKTQIVWGLIHDTDFVNIRNDYVTKMKAAGWHLDGTDQESVEAEAQFSKNPPLVTGSIKVAPLCKGYVTIRYKGSF